MTGLPAVGTRVSLRYRRPEGSDPPLTDVIGHLLQTGPRILVRTKTGAVVEIAADDVVAVRALTDAPVRTSQIRAMEHAAALAWPGTEQQWIDGWLVRGARRLHAPGEFGCAPWRGGECGCRTRDRRLVRAARPDALACGARPVVDPAANDFRRYRNGRDGSRSACGATRYDGGTHAASRRDVAAHLRARRSRRGVVGRRRRRRGLRHQR